MVQVVYQCVQVYFQDGFVHFQFECVGNVIEMEHTGPFYQNVFVVQLVKQSRVQKFGGVRKEIFLNFKSIGCCGDFFAHSDDMVYFPAVHQVGYLPVEQFAGLSTLQHVRQNQCAFAVFVLRASHHEIQSDVERSKVGVVAVINQCTAVFPFFHFQTHGNGFQMEHTLCDGFGWYHQVEGYGQTVE